MPPRLMRKKKQPGKRKGGDQHRAAEIYQEEHDHDKEEGERVETMVRGKSVPTGLRREGKEEK